MVYTQCIPRVSFHPLSPAYLAGLLLTIFVMHVYKHAQPALLYLVPACLGKGYSLLILLVLQ